MRRYGLGQARISRAGLRAGLGACTLLAALAVTPSALAARSPAPPPWTIQNTPNATVPGGQLEALSCSAASACTAVGTTLGASGIYLPLAERWNGTAWKVQSTPNPAGNTVPAAFPDLTGVSCPRSNFCEAVGAYSIGTVGISLADSWNGTTWTSQSFPVPPSSTSVDLAKVSCTSATFCEAVGSYTNSAGETLGFAARWNGATWKLQSTPDPAGSATVFMNGISCVSANFCEASGNSLEHGSFALGWNGTSWQLQTLPGTAGVGAVSCVSTAFCESVGFGGGDVWNGSAWSAQPIPGPGGSAAASLRSVSCATTAFCEAVGTVTDSQGNTLSSAATWNGTSWAAQSTPNPSGAVFASLNAVACAAAAACHAGGDYEVSRSTQALVALGESWDGSAWQLEPVVTPAGATSNGLAAVACVSQAFCEAVGSYTDNSGATVSLAEIWNGKTWTIQPTPDPAGISLNGVSCISAQFCEAVGFSSATGGAAEQWNGTSWVLQAIPGGGLTSLSCASASFCAATGFDGHVDKWNGSTWSAEAATAGITSLRSVSCTSPVFCEAVGAGQFGVQEAEQWDGTSWTLQVVPTPDGGSSVVLQGVSCTGETSCEVTGWYFGSTFQQLTLAEAWNGTNWAVQPTPNPDGSFAAQLQGVSCTSPTFCAAVGQYSQSVASLTLAEVWDGTAWNLRSTPSVAFAGQNILASVSCTKNDCTAAGVTTDLGQLGATLVETGG